MKSIMAFCLTLALLLSTKNLEAELNKLDPKCGTYNNKTLYRGAKGGCYYLNESNKKVYVDRTYCKC